VTIIETPAITSGVGTHAGVHVAAALDPVGALLRVQEFPATPGGYGRLLDWLAGFGMVCPWPGSKGPAATALAWPGISPRPRFHSLAGVTSVARALSKGRPGPDGGQGR
jgi:hypothetical protein